MKKVKIERDSWHFRLTNSMFGDMASKDFCTYWRYFALTCLITAGFVSLAGILLFLLVFAVVSAPAGLGFMFLLVALGVALTGLMFMSIEWISNNFHEWYVKYPVWGVLSVAAITLISCMFVFPVFGWNLLILVAMIAAGVVIVIGTGLVIAAASMLIDKLGDMTSKSQASSDKAAKAHVPKEPSIFGARYKAWKEKYCPRVEYVG